MFKKVEYVGFEGQPDLESKARHATDVLSGVIRNWRDEVAVAWRPASGSGHVLELSLSLALWNADGAASGGVRARGFDPGEDHLLRIDLREVWLNLLGELSSQQMKRLDDVLEPAEA